MKLKRALKVLAALLLFGFCPRAFAADSPLVGKWESIARERGSLGTTLELRPDGTLTASFGAIVDATYRVEGDTLTTLYRNGTTGKTDEAKMKIRFDQDTLIEKSAAKPDQEIRMKRERPRKPGDAPIVGTWSSPRPPNGTAYLTFTADGREFFRFAVKSIFGKWSASGNGLTIAYEGQPSETSTYTVENGVLSILSKNGQPTRYRRAPEPVPAR